MRRKYFNILVFASLILACLSFWAPAQGTGPLNQYKDNIHQLHLVAQYFTGSGQANIIQTITTIAVRSRGSETFWLIEKDHVDPAYYYRERRVPVGTPITFFFFIDVFDIIKLLQGQGGDPLEIFKLTDHYAVLRESRGRSIPDTVTVPDPQINEAAIIILPTRVRLTAPTTYSELSTQILQVPAESSIFFMGFALKDDDSTHGAPVFVKREGEWRLVGVRVVHERSTTPDQSAVAKVPSLDELTTKQ